MQGKVEIIKEIKLPVAKEFNLETSKATSITEAFNPSILLYKELLKVYSTVIGAELSPSICDQANELRKKFVKARTGIGAIHQAEKAYYLQAGRFVDALKNKLTEPIIQIESVLDGLANHYENIKKIELDKKEALRKEQILPYLSEIPSGLRDMSEEMFSLVLNGAKKTFAEKKKADEKEAKLEVIRKERAAQIKDYLLFAPEMKSDYSEYKPNEWKNIVEESKAKKIKHQAETLHIARFQQLHEYEHVSDVKDLSKLTESEFNAVLEKAKSDKKKSDDEKAEENKKTTAFVRSGFKDKAKILIENMKFPELPVYETNEQKIVIEEIEAKFSSYKTWALLTINKIQ